MALELESPEIVTLDEFLIAGFAHGSPPTDAFEGIWADFDERLSEYDELRKTGEYYGVVYEYDRDTAEYTYVAGVPVEDTDGLSPELTAVEIPESTYAVFDTSATEVEDLLTQVMDEWAQNADHEPLEGPLFEYYGAGNEPTERTGGYELYVPVEEGAATDDTVTDETATGDTTTDEPMTDEPRADDTTTDDTTTGETTGDTTTGDTTTDDTTTDEY